MSRRLRDVLGVLWLRLHYRLNGARYGHTPLTDPTNVLFRVVEDD
jgi:hypothetical protein